VKAPEKEELPLTELLRLEREEADAQPLALALGLLAPEALRLEFMLTRKLPEGVAVVLL